MANTIPEEEIRRAVAKLMHPEIDRALVGLGMIKDIALRDDKVILTMALPFPEIAIKHYLLHSV